MNFESFLSFYSAAFMAIFVIVDPFAVVPVFLSLTEDHKPAYRKTVCLKATLIACLILLAFALTGMRVFNLFGISLPAFQIAGGILLLRMGIAQLSADRQRVKKEEEAESLARDDISVFPIATPLLAGPGAISTVVLLSSKAQKMDENLALVLAIVTALIACGVMLLFAPRVFKVLGQTGLNILTRLMGILLTAIAIQFMINGALQIAKSF